MKEEYKLLKESYNVNVKEKMECKKKESKH